MKSKNPVARALYICGVVVAMLGFLVSLLRASEDVTNLLSGVFVTALVTVLLFGFGEMVNLLQKILDRLEKK